ncbi:MAG: hypothetical protein ACKO96_03355, partial [Flammeovirgaceae bacterium]
QWEYEIGEAPKIFNPEADLLAPSGDNVMNNSYHNSFSLSLLEKTLRRDSSGALGTLNGQKKFIV